MPYYSLKDPQKIFILSQIGARVLSPEKKTLFSGSVIPTNSALGFYSLLANETRTEGIDVVEILPDYVITREESEDSVIYSLWNRTTIPYIDIETSDRIKEIPSYKRLIISDKHSDILSSMASAIFKPKRFVEEVSKKFDISLYSSLTRKSLEDYFVYSFLYNLEKKGFNIPDEIRTMVSELDKEYPISVVVPEILDMNIPSKSIIITFNKDEHAPYYIVLPSKKSLASYDERMEKVSALTEKIFEYWDEDKEAPEELIREASRHKSINATKNLLRLNGVKTENIYGVIGMYLILKPTESLNEALDHLSEAMDTLTRLGVAEKINPIYALAKALNITGDKKKFENWYNRLTKLMEAMKQAGEDEREELVASIQDVLEEGKKYGFVYELPDKSRILEVFNTALAGLPGGYGELFQLALLYAKKNDYADIWSDYHAEIIDNPEAVSGIMKLVANPDTSKLYLVETSGKGNIEKGVYLLIPDKGMGENIKWLNMVKIKNG